MSSCALRSRRCTCVQDALLWRATSCRGCLIGQKAAPSWYAGEPGSGICLNIIGWLPSNLDIWHLTQPAQRFDNLVKSAAAASMRTHTWATQYHLLPFLFTHQVVLFTLTCICATIPVAATGTTHQATTGVRSQPISFPVTAATWTTTPQAHNHQPHPGLPQALNRHKAPILQMAQNPHLPLLPLPAGHVTFSCVRHCRLAGTSMSTVAACPPTTRGSGCASRGLAM